MEELAAGEVGIVVAGIKTLADVQIGDTITTTNHPAQRPLPGFREVKPMVFTGLYPVDAEDYEDLKAALEKLDLNDSSFVYEPETSAALGFGFRCGFLGFLHAEIIQERLEREYGLNLITTAPTVRYRVVPNGRASPSRSRPRPRCRDPSETRARRGADHLAPPSTCPRSTWAPSGALSGAAGRPATDMTQYRDRVQVHYELPLAEVVTDFHDRIKSATRGYGSFDYELVGYQPADLVKLDILVNGDPVDALSLIVHRDKAYARGNELTRKLKEFIPRQMFQVAIQAAIGSRIIARTTVQALRKNVTAKCYGGDITASASCSRSRRQGRSG